MFSTHDQSAHWDTHVNAQHFTPNEKFNNMVNRPTSSMPINESELVNHCRRELTDGKLKKPMDHMRMLCLARGASGIYNLGRSFRRMADHGDHLSLDGFRKVLQDLKMDCSKEEATEIFNEHRSNGHINIKQFLFDLRLLTELREAMIDKCFKKADKGGNDVISINDLRRTYSVKKHPLYVNGDEDKEEIMKRFLATFEQGDNPSAKITHEEFLNYYAGISASIEEDGYFDLLLREEYNL